jgi:hypothetical protein
MRQLKAGDRRRLKCDRRLLVVLSYLFPEVHDLLLTAISRVSEHYP